MKIPLRRSFLNISYVGLGTVFNAALGFVFLSVVARSLAVDQFGRYALLATLLVSLSKILDFGTNSNYVAGSITTQDKKLIDHFISVKILLFVAAIFISLPIIFLFDLGSPVIVLTFLLGLLFYGFNYTLFGLFQRMEHYTALILLNMIPALIKGFFAVLIFFKVVDLSFENYFMVFSFAIGPSALLYLILPSDIKKFKFDFSQVGKTLKQALSPGISQLITEGFSAVSNSLAKIYTNFTSVGLYSLADKISGSFVLVSYTIFTVLLPKNALRKREKKGYDYAETAVLSMGILLLSVITIVLAKFFVPWFFQHKYDESLDVLNILVFSGAISSIHSFMENYFFVEGKTKYLAFISGGKLASLIVFSMILIPLYSLRGLAFSLLLASAISLGVVMYLMSKQKTIDTNQPL